MLADFKTLLKHSLIYGAGVALGKAVGFVMVPVYTRCLNPSEYGTLEMLSRSGELVALVSALGFVSALPRFYFDYATPRDQHRVVSTGLLFTRGRALAVAAVLMPLGRWLSVVILGTPEGALLCRLLLVSVVFDMGTLIPLTYLRIQQRSGLYTVANLCRLAAAVGLNIYLIAVLRMGVAGAIWSMLAVAVGVALVLSGWTLRRTGVGFDLGMAKAMLRYGLPLIPASLCLLTIQASDRFFLRGLTSLSEVGIYALGYKFAMMLGVLVTGPLMLIWTTYIFEIAKRPQAPAIYARALTYYALAAVAFALPLCLFGRELLALVATPHYLAAYRVIPLVALGFGFLGCASVMEVGIYLRRRTGVRLGNMATAAAANLGLNWLLVPRLGGMGAAWAAMGALGLLAVLTYVTCRRLYPVPYELGRLARLAAVTAGAWLAYSQGAVALPGGAQVAAKLAILAAVPVALYAVGFFLPSERAALGRLGRRKAEVGA